MRSHEVSPDAHHVLTIQGEMKQVILEIEDSVFERFMGMAELCQGVKVVSTSDMADTRDIVNLCVAKAITELQKRKVLAFSSDHTFIMLLINQGLVDKHLFFASPLDYIKYLKEIGIEHVPCKSRLYLMVGNTRGKYPEWTFSDNKDTGETTRRNNVARQFLSACLREKRALAEGLTEK